MKPGTKTALTVVGVILAIILFVVWSSIRENEREEQQKEDWSRGYDAGFSDGIDDANEGWLGSADLAYDRVRENGASTDYITAYLIGYAKGYGSQRNKVGYYWGYTDAMEGAEYEEDAR